MPYFDKTLDQIGSIFSSYAGPFYQKLGEVFGGREGGGQLHLRKLYALFGPYTE